MLLYNRYLNRDEWLEGRINSIGASEAAAIVGVSKWMTATQLWEIKTGRAHRQNLDDNVHVQYGIRAEPHLRGLFMAKHPELILNYNPFDILYQEGRPWLTATLDGELTVPESDRRYVYEGKTAVLSTKADWAEWDNRIKDAYYVQILHQLLVTDWDGVFVYAELIGRSGNSQLREYFFDKEDCTEDMAWLLAQETEFWHCVETNTRPKVKLYI